ncbi:hypothetical protein BD410DRAFT_154740 [Rickenella mellea]|uniref:Uncharacterized protein n=1 Tax=Rickenella mellea TaxID=50990 RepID=A0A4Y7PI79_9AGAM|nr:hypothetical protein BD410DRAFT_154740 [Rickenella mellea]
MRKRSNTASSLRHQHHRRQHRHQLPPHPACASIAPTLPHFHTHQTSGVDLRPPGATQKRGCSSSDAIHRICGFIHDDRFSDVRVGSRTGGGRRRAKESSINATILTPRGACEHGGRLEGVIQPHHRGHCIKLCHSRRALPTPSRSERDLSTFSPPPLKSTTVPSDLYLSDLFNAYAHLGMPKLHVHIVPSPSSLALDARTTVNEARFARSVARSEHQPKAVLRPVLRRKPTTKTSPQP